MPDLGEFFRRLRADLAVRRVRIDKLGELLLERSVAPAQRVILCVGNDRRILAVVAPVMLGDLGLKPRMLVPRLGEGELGRSFLGGGHDIKLAQGGCWRKGRTA